VEKIAIQAVGPGAFTVAIAAGGLELSVRLDGSGARLGTVAL
jgi:hypothetical protein